MGGMSCRVWGCFGACSHQMALPGLLPDFFLHPIGSKESLFSSTITASEEAMTVLEEVIMYTFQQCVYYISKVRSAPRHRRQREHPQQFCRSCSASATPRCFPWG